MNCDCSLIEAAGNFPTRDGNQGFECANLLPLLEEGLQGLFSNTPTSPEGLHTREKPCFHEDNPKGAPVSWAVCVWALEQAAPRFDLSPGNFISDMG